MPDATSHPSRGRKELHEILKTCEAIIERKFNPFFLDVHAAISTLREYFPSWKQVEDHCLDALTINRLSKVVRLQKSQLEYESSLLYVDPSVLRRRISALSTHRLADILVKAWHPIVELEQLTERSIIEALEYWEKLLPLEERWKRLGAFKKPQPREADVEELIKMGILTKSDFAQSVRELWEQLKNSVRDRGVLDYWSFVRSESREETIRRAYLVSFLVTYGYARIQVHDREIRLVPNESQIQLHQDELLSFPISISPEPHRTEKS